MKSVYGDTPTVDKRMVESEGEWEGGNNKEEEDGAESELDLDEGTESLQEPGFDPFSIQIKGSPYIESRRNRHLNTDRTHYTH